MSANRPVLITGCQRSGTTLLLLILDSHPGVRGLDETDYDPLRLSHPDYHPAVAFKLPTCAHEVLAMRAVEGLRVLWCLRDPRDVAASMLALGLPLGGQVVCWANHPTGADHEVVNCSHVLGCTLDPGRFALLRSFHQARARPPHARSRADGVFAAGLCWRLKQELLPLYARLDVPCHVVRYEDLVLRPGPTLRGVTDFLGLPWHDDLLRHHDRHAGTAIGDTDRSRPIDPKGVGKWREALTGTDLHLLRSVCGETAAEYGYDLGGGPA
jgi:protein-tyrosine sulfotransferase